MTPMAAVHMLGHWPYELYSENALLPGIVQTS